VALASAAKKRYSGDPELRVVINRRTGGYETFRRWLVMADAAQIDNPDRQMALDHITDQVIPLPAGAGVAVSTQSAQNQIDLPIRQLVIDQRRKLGCHNGDIVNE